MADLLEKMNNLKKARSVYDKALQDHQIIQNEICEDLKEITWGDQESHYNFSEDFKMVKIDCTNKSRGIIKVYNFDNNQQQVLIN